MKNSKLNGRYVTIGVVVLLVFTAVIVGKAQTSASFWENAARYFGQSLAEKMEVPSVDVFGASGTRFPNGLSADSTSPSAGQVRGTSLTVTGVSTLTGTSTQGLVSYDSAHNISLTLTSTSTTPGGAGSITNTGATKICQLGEVEITSGSSAGGRLGAGSAFVLSVATTTSVGTSVLSGNLIASSTVATSSTPLLDTVVNKGSGVNVAGQSFQWTATEAIQVQWEGTTTDPATSTTALAGMAGELYITCHTR